MVTSYSHLAPADVYAAPAYCHDHRQQIDEDLRRADELIDRMWRTQSDANVKFRGPISGRWKY